VAIGAADLGSIGRITREALIRYGGKELYTRIQNNAMYFVTDSRELAQLIEKGIVDAGISWKATAFFPDDRDRIDAVDLPEALSSPRWLELATLRYSRDPEGAKEFVDLAASPQGRKIMTEYGFR
jgi:molybdate transport system substrate-binding protein